METRKLANIKASNIKVSIIMPIKNTVNYIKECMESLIHQTLKEIEILCIDAQSTDGTREILQEYAEKDSRVHLYDDTKGSTGYANNYGMQNAKGEYLAIVEPDDFVALDMYEKLYQAAKENDADVVRADYKVFFGNGSQREYIDKAIASADDYGKIHCPEKEQWLFQNDMSTWAGIMLRELYEQGEVCHNETPGAAYQDNGFWFLTMAHAKRLYYLPASGYRYRMDNPDSSIHNRGKLFAICDEYAFIRTKLEQGGIFEKFEKVYIWAKFIRYLSSYYRLDDTLKSEFARRFALEMQEHYEKGKLQIQDFSKGQQRLLKDLLADSEVFHQNIMAQKEVFRQFIESGKTLVQYGCGSDGFRLLNYMRTNHCLDRVECLCDSNPRLWGSALFGKKIYSLNKVKLNHPDACYLVASIHYGDEIEKMLRQNGIEENRICMIHFC